MLRPTGGWRYRKDTEILFPMRVAPCIRALRGNVWRKLVDRVWQAADGDPDTVAFSLAMVQLSGCMTCHTDCYRALRGCTFCASQAVKRYRGSDKDLLDLFEVCKSKVRAHLGLDGPQSEINGRDRLEETCG